MIIKTLGCLENAGAIQRAKAKIRGIDIGEAELKELNLRHRILKTEIRLYLPESSFSRKKKESSKMKL